MGCDSEWFEQTSWHQTPNIIFSIYHNKGTTAVSGSDEKTIIVWETLRGLALTSLQLHVQFTRFDISLECSRILVHLTDNPSFPIICLHNSPAQYIKLPTYSAPARDVEGKKHNISSWICFLCGIEWRIDSQIYDQRQRNDRREDYSRKSCRLTHIRGKRNTPTWHHPSWWLKSMSGSNEDFPCQQAWKKSRKLPRWRISDHKRTLVIPSKPLWLSRSTLISLKHFGTNDPRLDGGWIKWVEQIRLKVN